MSITGADMKRLRERRNLSQTELAQILNASLTDRSYTSGSVSPWENEKRNIPPDVASLVEQLLLETALPDDGPPNPSPGRPESGDTAPRGDDPPSPQAPILSGGGTYVRACTELWEMIATGVGMAGAATGNQALMMDGAIIAADKEALGEAWGRLAETNDTFRRMLLGMTEGSVWLQVALVTGTTVSKCYQGHVELAHVQQQVAPDNGNVDLAAA